MSDSNASQETELATLDDAKSPTKTEEVVDEVRPTKMTLWGEIMKGWEWIVFGWRMLRRLGGFGEILRTLFIIASMLIKRMLVHWGILSKR